MNRAPHIIYGLGYAMLSLYDGFEKGITGIIRLPYN